MEVGKGAESNLGCLMSAFQCFVFVICGAEGGGTPDWLPQARTLHGLFAWGGEASLC